MKLLTKQEATSKKKQENDALIESNIRLRQKEKDILGKLNGLKTNYDPEKIKAFQEYQTYMEDLNGKKSKALAELTAIQRMVDDKKEAYYKLLEREDELIEKMYLASEREKKLDLREAFVKGIEQKIHDKRP